MIFLERQIVEPDGQSECQQGSNLAHTKSRGSKSMLNLFNRLTRLLQQTDIDWEGRILLIKKLSEFLHEQLIILHDNQRTTLLEKYPTFFCEILVDFNEARLHEKTLNLHTQV